MTLVPDSSVLSETTVISFPDNEEDRKRHPSRTIIVMSNDLLCADLATPLVTVAPTSSQLKWKNKTEVVIRKSDTNGLEHDSRVMLAHLQPIIKTDVERKIGELSWDDWERIMGQIVKNFDRA